MSATTDGRALLIDVLAGNNGPISTEPLSIDLPTSGFVSINAKFEFRSLNTRTDNKVARTPVWSIQPFVRLPDTAWQKLAPWIWRDPENKSPQPQNGPAPAPLLPAASWMGNPATLGLIAVNESPQTDAVWAQLLPDSNATSVTSDGGTTSRAVFTGQLALARNTSDEITLLQEMDLEDPQPVTIVDPKFPDSPCEFATLLAVTEKITDFRGQPDEERFLGLYVADHSTPPAYTYIPLTVPVANAPALPPPPLAHLGPLRARIITLQIQRAKQQLNDLGQPWWNLFQNSAAFPQGTDEVVRVVSVSPPIDELDVDVQADAPAMYDGVIRPEPFLVSVRTSV